jgi:hypothetical protein
VVLARALDDEVVVVAFASAAICVFVELDAAVALNVDVGALWADEWSLTDDDEV